MRSRIAIGVAAGMLFASLGPILADVGEQSGNHPEARPGTRWAKVEERKAAWGYWSSGTALRTDYFTVSAWTRETRLATVGDSAQTVFSGAVTLQHQWRGPAGNVVESTSLRVPLDRGDFFANVELRRAWVGATLERPDGSTCSLEVDWSGEGMLNGGGARTVNAEESWRYASAVLRGSCISPYASLDRDSNRIWQRVERRTSEDVLSDDRMMPGGIVTVAGVREAGAAGDGGPARWAFLSHPRDVASAPDGSIYIVEHERVRRVAPDGTISTFCGSKQPRPCGAAAVAVAPDGSIYLAGAGVRRLAPDGTETAIGGESWRGPYDVAVDSHGRVFVAEMEGHRIRRVDPDGTIAVVAGTGACGPPIDGVPATQAPLCSPQSLAVGTDQTVHVVDGSGRVRRIAADGTITTTTTTEPAASVAAHGDGTIFAGTLFGRVYRLEGPVAPELVAGGGWGPGDGGPALVAFISDASALAFDAAGYLLIVETYGHAVRLADVGLGG